MENMMSNVILRVDIMNNKMGSLIIKEANNSASIRKLEAQM